MAKFFEQLFLNELKTYLEDAFSKLKVNIYLARGNELEILYNMKPPLIMFKDGSIENIDYDEKHLEYVIPFLCCSEIFSEVGGQVSGAHNQQGVVYWTRNLAQTMTYNNLLDGLQPNIGDNTQIQGVHWESVSESEAFAFEQGSAWQIREIRFRFYLALIG